MLENNHMEVIEPMNDSFILHNIKQLKLKLALLESLVSLHSAGRAIRIYCFQETPQSSICIVDICAFEHHW